MKTIKGIFQRLLRLLTVLLFGICLCLIPIFILVSGVIWVLTGKVIFNYITNFMQDLSEFFFEGLD